MARTCTLRFTFSSAADAEGSPPNCCSRASHLRNILVICCVSTSTCDTSKCVRRHVCAHASVRSAVKCSGLERCWHQQVWTVYPHAPSSAEPK